jgi:hypothetical protein
VRLDNDDDSVDRLLEQARERHADVGRSTGTRVSE